MMNPNPPCDQFPLPCICCRQRAQLEIDLKSSEVFFRKIAAKTGLELGKVAQVFSTLKVIAIQELREKQRFHLRGLAMFTVKTTPAQKKKTRQKSTAKKAPVKEARPSKKVLSVEAASGRAVDVGVAGWTPKEIKEMILTPAHIRRANTFDPTEQSPEERREESSGTPQKKPRKRKAARKGSPGVGGDAYQLNMADAGILLVVLYAAFHLFRQMFGGAGSVNG